MPASRFDTVGPTRPKQLHPRWRVEHSASGIVYMTTTRHQYAREALLGACDEGFAHAVMDAGFGWPTLNDVVLSTKDEPVTTIDYAANPKPEGLETKGVA